VVVFVFNDTFGCQHTFWGLHWGGISLVNQSNCSSPNMSSEIDPKNDIMLTLEDIPEEQRKAIEARHQAIEERRKAKEVQELQEFLSGFKRER
jgi:hypothetical protein